MTELLGLGFHEFDANWVFEYDGSGRGESGLRPFYAFENTVRDCGGSKKTTVEHDGETYYLTLYYQESGIDSLNHPSSDLNTVREFRIKWERQDEVGQCSGTFHLAPRTPHMTKEDGTAIRNTPDIVGVNIRAQGSNLDFREYLPLFRKAVASLGISRRYWQDEHLYHDQFSNIQDGEVYVRLADGTTGPLISVDGVIARIMNLCASDREGYRKHVADDRKAPGYYHTATIGEYRASELIDRHRYGKEVKHYLPKQYQTLSEDHVLKNPKLGVSFQGSKTKDPVYWGDLDHFIRELEETLLNVLQWDGYPITADQLADGHPYVDEDPYVNLEPSHRSRRVVDDPTPELREQEENIVIKHLSDGLEDSDLDVLEQLVADGGQTSPKDVADDTGWHVDTIYRALDRMSELVEHSYGDLQLRSHHVAEKVTVAVQEARRAGQDALVTAAQALERERDMEIADDALVQWADSNGVDIEDRDDAALRLRVTNSFDSKDDLIVTLQQGFYNWRKTGWKAAEFLNARLVLESGGRWNHLQVRDVIH